MPWNTRPARALAACTVAAALVAVPLAPAAASGLPGHGRPARRLLPEGIAGGRGTTFYAGSRPGPTGGAVYVGDLRTGEGELLVAPTPGGASIGMAYDDATGVLWVAGGPTGTVTGYDGATGEVVARYTAPASPTGRFLNDVTFSGDSVYVTDSLGAELVVVPRRGGDVDGEAPGLLPLSGDWSQAAGFNANGIRTLPGGDLVVVDGGALLVVDPATGVADRLEQTDGRTLTAGDGLELRGSTLYVVFGFGEDSVAVVDLDLASGTFSTTGALTRTSPSRTTSSGRPPRCSRPGRSGWSTASSFRPHDRPGDRPARPR